MKYISSIIMIVMMALASQNVAANLKRTLRRRHYFENSKSK